MFNFLKTSYGELSHLPMHKISDEAKIMCYIEIQFAI